MIKVFNLYEQYNNYNITKKFISKYIGTAKKNINYWKDVLHLIQTKFNNYSVGINIKLQTGKAPKKVKNVGRIKIRRWSGQKIKQKLVLKN